MYKDDAIIQKILATLFTVAYFGLSFMMFRFFVVGDINMGEFEISFISTIFGAMSANVNTVVDFFFGGSSKKNEQQQNSNTIFFAVHCKIGATLYIISYFLISDGFF